MEMEESKYLYRAHKRVLSDDLGILDYNYNKPKGETAMVERRRPRGQLVEGKKYLIRADKISCKCELTNIQTYPATGMPRDFMFTPLEGEEPLSKHEAFYPSFPLPEMLLHRFEVIPLDDEGVVIPQEELDNSDIDEIFQKLRNCPLEELYNPNAFNEILEKLKDYVFNDEQKAQYKAILEDRLKGLTNLLKDD